MSDTKESIVHQYPDKEILCDELSLHEQRSLIFHLLYAAEAFEYQMSLEAIVDNFARGFGIIIPKETRVFKDAQAIIEKKDILDALIMPLLDNWRFERLGICTKLILRLALYELLAEKEDAIVIINEAIELAKCFAEKDSFKFINGILDQFIKQKNAPA